MRDELLNCEIFDSTQEAKALIEINNWPLSYFELLINFMIFPEIFNIVNIYLNSYTCVIGIITSTIL